MNIELLLVMGVVILISLLLNFLLIKYSSKLKLVDTPNARSMHTVQKSRAGGIAIFFSFMIGVYLLKINIDIFLMIAFLIVFFVGIYDDVFVSSSKTKFFWISVAAIFLYFSEIYIGTLGTFIGVELILSPFIAIPFTLFAVVGFVNAMNLIDGLDGLSSGVAIIILIAFGYLGYKYDDMFLFYLSLLLIMSLSSFLFYNWFPSKIFMGDSGSLTLGFTIAVLSIHSVQHGYISPVTVLLLTAVPILDTLIVMIRRLRRGKNPFDPDNTHIHHIILKQHYKNVPKTTIILILLQSVFSYIGLGFKVRDDLVVLVIFVLLFILFYNMLTPKKIRIKK